jgi:FAD:protein FMN transferase
MLNIQPSGGDSTVAIDEIDDEPSNTPMPERYELIRRDGRPMATEVSVQIAALRQRLDVAETAADACMAWFDEVDLRLSRFMPGSELSRLNAAAGEWFAASEMLYECAALAVASAESSDGLYDPTMLRRLRDLGYDRDFAAIAHQEMPRADSAPLGRLSQPPIDRAAWREIAFDSARQRIRLPADAQLDLGGIAKGWAADVALARFGASFPGALINVGGDLRARGGPQSGTLWTVGIRDPRRELDGPPETVPHLATVALSRGAMATSGAVRRWWLRDGQRQHHLLDPRTGQPMPLWTGADDESAGLIATATAFAPTAARAEVAAKVALLRGYPTACMAVEAAWERYGALGPEDDVDAGIALALVFGDGTVTYSGNLNDYLATWGTDGAALPLVIRPHRPYLSLSDFRQMEHSL